MKSYRYIRSLIGTSVYVAASLAAPVSFGAAADRHQVQAQLLDNAELLCANCFFGASDYYYCFATDNTVLIGYQRIPVLNWRDKSKNYLTRVHPAWAAWGPPGQTVPISYDDKHIWVTRVDGKQVKLTQSYSRDIFTSNDRCQEAVRAKAH
jgi:hypothetical protein